MSLKSLGFGLDVLNYFSKPHIVWGLRELAKEMKVSHTVLNRALKELANKNFLYQSPTTKKYELGFGIEPFILTYKEQNSLRKLTRNKMMELSNVTGESIFLLKNDKHEATTVEVVESPSPLKFVVSKGTIVKLHSGAFTWSILAHLDNNTINNILDCDIQKRTTTTHTERKDILKKLDEIRKNGWSYSEGEYSENIFGLSVPIFISNGKLFGSLTITGPSSRIDKHKIKIYLPYLLETKDKIETLLNIYFEDIDNTYY